MEELERITKRGLKELTRRTWTEMASKIISQAQLEGHTRGVASALEVMNDVKGVCSGVWVWGGVLSDQ